MVAITIFFQKQLSLINHLILMAIPKPSQKTYRDWSGTLTNAFPIKMVSITLLLQHQKIAVVPKT